MGKKRKRRKKSSKEDVGSEEEVESEEEEEYDERSKKKKKKRKEGSKKKKKKTKKPAGRRNIRKIVELDELTSQTLEARRLELEALAKLNEIEEGFQRESPKQNKTENQDFPSSHPQPMNDETSTRYSEDYSDEDDIDVVPFEESSSFQKEEESSSSPEPKLLSPLPFRPLSSSDEDEIEEERQKKKRKGRKIFEEEEEQNEGKDRFGASVQEVVVSDDSLSERNSESDFESDFESDSSFGGYDSSYGDDEREGILVAQYENHSVISHPHFAGLMKAHQIEGLKFLWKCAVSKPMTVALMKKKEEGTESTKGSGDVGDPFETDLGGGCILAHSMGLGKTLTTISFIHTFIHFFRKRRTMRLQDRGDKYQQQQQQQKQEKGKKKIGERVIPCILVFSPMNCIRNWLSEFSKWLPEEDLENEESSDLNDPWYDPDYGRCYEDFFVFELMKGATDFKKRANRLGRWRRVGGVLVLGYEGFRSLVRKAQQQQQNTTTKDARMVLEALVNPGPDVVIADEGHRIKSRTTAISSLVKQIRTQRRIILTGYPLQNNLEEYWVMTDFIKPSYLGSFSDFSNAFIQPIKNGSYADSSEADKKLMLKRLHVLTTEVESFVHRRDYSLLRRALPSLTEYVFKVSLTKLQQALYECLLTKNRASRGGDFFSLSTQSLVVVNHPDIMHKICSGEKTSVDTVEESGDEVETTIPSTALLGPPPSAHGVQSGEFSIFLSLFGKEYTEGSVANSGKTTVFFEILENAILNREKVLLFTKSIATLNCLEELLGNRDVPRGGKKKWRRERDYFRLDGSTHAGERHRMITAFNRKSSVHLFLLSTKAGSLGINLQAASRVIIYDACFNPCHDTQALFRSYRFGQTRPVVAYRLIAQGTVEDVIFSRQVAKQGLFSRVVERKNIVDVMSRDHVAQFFIFKPLSQDPNAIQKVKSSDRVDNVTKEAIEKAESQIQTIIEFDSLLEEDDTSQLTEAEIKESENEYQQLKLSGFKHQQQSPPSIPQILLPFLRDYQSPKITRHINSLTNLLLPPPPFLRVMFFTHPLPSYQPLQLTFDLHTPSHQREADKSLSNHSQRAYPFSMDQGWEWIPGKIGQ